MGASQQRQTVAVRAKQLIKLTFALRLDMAPFVIKHALLLYRLSGKEGGVAQCD